MTPDAKDGEDRRDGPRAVLGDAAPDFTLRDQFGQDVTLSDFRGRKAVVLLFYPYAFSGVCTGEMAGIRDRLDEFLTFDTEVLAISCDPVYSLRAFADAEGLNFPLLSDFWPHGAVATAYEVFDEVKGDAAPVVLRHRPRGQAGLGGAQRQPRGPRPRRAPRAARRGTGLNRSRARLIQSISAISLTRLERGT